MRRILITGSNRGIGLELVERYLKQDDTFIFASCRHISEASTLNTLALQYAERVRLVQLDVTKQQSIDEAVEQISREVDGLEMLVNNAGILPGGVASVVPNAAKFGFLEAEAMEEVFRVNAIAPIMIAQAFSSLLRKGTSARLINMTSDAGSIEMTQSAYHYSYKASKAALNMVSRCLSTDFRADGVIVVSIHPGWIQTDMGGPHATRTPAETIPSMMKVIDGLTMADSGKFFNWDGKPLPW
ncbi:MAG: SDR family NAD(P)-dependent oxidoreductase [Anaerolineaceae bacterium]|nr:SDR family NAD(P)-dependent oxidoreductase [Anaerolineaceae bacterium]